MEQPTTRRLERTEKSLLTRALIFIGLKSDGDGADQAPLASKVLLILGSISVYNVINHYQTITDLSHSFHWLAGWWRYLISLPFQWLNLHLHSLQRELITLLLFFTSAASIALARYSGLPAHKMWSRIFKEAFDSLAFFERSSTEPKSILGRAGRGCLLLTIIMVLTIAVGLAITGPTPLFYKLGIGSAVYSAGLFVLLGLNWAFEKLVSRDYFDVRMKILMTYMIPVAIWKAWLGTLAEMHREIISILRILVLILIFDIAAKVALDPLLQSHPTLPEPPSAIPQ